MVSVQCLKPDEYNNKISRAVDKILIYRPYFIIKKTMPELFELLIGAV